jgi:hypothetical protein
MDLDLGVYAQVCSEAERSQEALCNDGCADAFACAGVTALGFAAAQS